MNKRIFVISDTHFGHKNILEFEPIKRPFTSIEEHDETLIQLWNETVGKNDTVWHLGDVLFGAKNFSILERLNGIKKLVMGNHDRYPMAKYLEHFTQVCGSAEMKGCILTHLPIYENQFSRYRANIHGHLHSKKLDDPRYICVSVEHTDLRPILLDLVIDKLLSESN